MIKFQENFFQKGGPVYKGLCKSIYNKIINYGTEIDYYRGRKKGNFGKI